MAKKCFLQYPCGKLFEIKIPISLKESGKDVVVMPGSENYLKYARLKFEINNLKVVEKEIEENKYEEINDFISLSKKKNVD